MKTILLALFLSVFFYAVQAQALSVVANNDTSICVGDTITLEAVVTGGTAPYTYKWLKAQWFECDTCATTRAFTPHDTNYIVQVIDSVGAIVADYVRVTIDTVSMVSGAGMFDIEVFGDSLAYYADSIKISIDSNRIGNWIILLEGAHDFIDDSVSGVGSSYIYDGWMLNSGCGGVKNYWDCEMDVSICFQPDSGCVKYCLDTTILIGKLHGGIGASNTIQMQVYPTPANNSVRFSSDVYQAATVQIFNTLGILEHQENLLVLADAELNITTLSPGVYYVHVNTPVGQAIHKLVKE